MTAPAPLRIRADDALLLVVDVQERLLPYIHDGAAVVAQCVRMLRAAREFPLPILVSEQYPKGLGPTNPEVAAAAGDAPRIEKNTFSVLADEAARERVLACQRAQVLLVGIEAHVCVAQTALDLVTLGLRPVVLADAVGSRRPLDRDVALARLRDAGVLVTTVEAALFELLALAGTDLFKRIAPLVK